MKKKIVLILSIVALMVVVFALSVSASNYVDLDDFSKYSPDVGESFYLYTSVFDRDMQSGQELEFNSTAGEFGFFYISGIDSLFGFINIEKWHELLSKEVIDSPSDFKNVVLSWQDGLILPMPDNVSGYSFFFSQFDAYHEKAYALYQQYVAELNEPTYEDGLAEGVAEYIESDEYKNALLAERAAGKLEGIDTYKKSDPYIKSLNAEYTRGLEDGEANFVKSEEYATALQTEYNQGKADGAANSKAGDVKTIAFSVVGIALLGLVVYWLMTKFHKGKRRR